MKRIIGLILSLFIAIACPAYAEFVDVPENHYGFEAINKVQELKIITGYTDGTYGPDKNITRAEMATVLCKMSGLELAKDASNPFPDVRPDHWATSYISAAAKAKIIVGGSDGLFRPDDNVTYEEAIKMTIAATGKAQSVKAPSANWSLPYLEIADTCNVSEGLKSKKGEFATRADVAIMIYNALKIKDNPNMTLFANQLYNSDVGIVTNASFALDMSIFAKDNTIYSKELAKASCILSMNAYDYINLEGKSGKNANELLKNIGFEKIKSIDLKTMYQDSHITHAYIGKRNIVVDGTAREVVCVVVRGTNESLKEWSSNFDVGSATDAKEYRGEHHKGYDIASNRLMQKVEEYILENTDPTLPKSIWITGHSRGAAIATICGKDLGDKGNTCYVYSFATPNSTTSENRADYNYIFNILNEDDLITYIPLEEWGFGLYGKSAKISVSDKMLSKWQASTGLQKYKAKKDISAVVAALAQCTPTRESCYQYRKDGAIYIGVNSIEEGETVIEQYKSSFAKASLDHVRFATAKASSGSKYPYYVSIDAQPAFWMQNVAGVMGGEVGYLTFSFLPLPDYMMTAHAGLIAAYLAGMTHPHTPETYYVLAQNLTQNDFK